MKFKLFIILFTFLFSVSFKQQNKKDIILWDESRMLTWDDFKGKPEKRFAAASTSYDIIKTVNKGAAKTVFVKIEAMFFCESSWKKKSWVNQQVLEHEQKHFDIVELYARKLRKLIKQGTYTSLANVETKADAFYKIIDKEMDKYHDLYDEETDGSMNGDKQREWQTKIMKEIKVLDAYKETTLQINF